MVNVRVDNILRTAMFRTTADGDPTADGGAPLPPDRVAADGDAELPHDGDSKVPPGSTTTATATSPPYRTYTTATFIPVSGPTDAPPHASSAWQEGTRPTCSDETTRRLGSGYTFASGGPPLPPASTLESGQAEDTYGRGRTRLDSRQYASRPYDNGVGGFARSARTPPPNPYHGSRDTRNDAARSDLGRYDAHVPPYQQRPRDVDVNYGSEEEENFPQGGQIISP